MRYRSTDIKVLLPSNAIVIDVQGKLAAGKNSVTVSTELQEDMNIGLIFSIPESGACVR